MNIKLLLLVTLLLLICYTPYANSVIITGLVQGGDSGDVTGPAIPDSPDDIGAEPAKGADDNYATDAEKIILGNTSGTNTGDEPDASTSVKGVVELAEGSEVTTGTSATLAVTPDALAGSGYGIRVVSVKIISDDTALTTGDGKFTWLVPFELNGWNIVGVSAGVSTVSSSGLPEFDLYNVTDSTDILTTNITIDATEFHSSGATTAAVINTSYDDLATGDRIRIDCDTAGTGAKGAQIDIKCQLP